jgi:phospholipid-binding lipoprotein MlaA
LQHGLRTALAAALLLTAAAPAAAFSERALELTPRPRPSEPLQFVALAEVLPQPAAEAAASDPYAADADLYADDEAWDEEGSAAVPEPDPFEGANRRLLSFNNGVDRFLLDPASRLYGFVMPDPAERAVLRAFSNLNSPAVFVNDVFQFEFKRAGVTLSRFAMNSTVGLAGLFDVAGAIGLEGHTSDFGQTMARFGVGSGPYVVIPLLGPSTARDAVGFGVDMFFRPLFYLLGPLDFLIVGTGNGFVVRSSYVDELKALREGSVDYYATLRNVYFQRRAEQLREVGIAD